MTLPSPRVPEAEAERDIPVLSFPKGLLGLPQAQHFVLVRADDQAETGLFTLRCLEDATLQFVVADPSRFFPGYSPTIDDGTCEVLTLTSAEDAVSLIVLTVGDGPADSTGNLLAPLVVHIRSLMGVQTVLADSGYGTRVPLGTSGRP